MSRNHDLFHPMAVAMEIDESGKTRQHPVNAYQFYIGQISDDTTSRVKLHITPSGILTASITTENDIIYIEVIVITQISYLFINILFSQPANT